MRIAMGVEYDGARFHGWQRQGHDPLTVQEALEAALSKVADHEITAICAGRTDAGVHGIGQVVHFDTTAERDLRAWVMGPNTFLPADIAVKWARIVSDDFHARFAAMSRRYCYVIHNHPARPALGRSHVTWQYRPLNIDRMHEASRCLLGTHDFTSFRATGCQARSPVKTMHEIEFHRVGDLVFMSIRGDAFLHHMVRNIAGVLMAIGAGHKQVDWASAVLNAKDRAQGGVTALPNGLYFMGVEYPPHFGIPVSDARFPPMMSGVHA